MLTRLVSALVALPIVLWLIHQGGWWFLGLIVVATAIALQEALAMATPDRVIQAVLTPLGVLLVPLAAHGVLAGPFALPIAGAGFLAVLLLFLFRPGEIASAGARLGLASAALLWIGALMACLALLRQLPGGVGWLYLACGLAWGSDTGGYFAGRFLGRHKLYPLVSPKKTWEGSVGGVISATAIAFALQRILGEPAIPELHLLVVGPIVAALGQTGDLAESLLKRSAGVKDSGRIMPGHGGLFDRVDALLFTAPALLVYATFVLGLRPEWM